MTGGDGALKRGDGHAMMDERKPRVGFHGIKMATKCLPKKELPSKQVLTQLSAAHLEIAKQTYETVGDFLSPSYEHWERQARLDPFPDRRLLKWIKIAKALEAYRANHIEVTDAETLKRVAFLLFAASNGHRFPHPATAEGQTEFFKFDTTD
jgi:hypothetical protein